MKDELKARKELIDELENIRQRVAGLEKSEVERQQLEKVVHENEKRYRTLVEESFDGIFIQKGSKIIFTNQRLCEMLGYEKNEIEGMDHWLIYHPEYQNLTRERAKARMRGEKVPSQYEVRLLRKNGSCFDGEINARAIALNGDPGIQVWVRDITERKKVEEALENALTELTAIYKNAPIAMMLVDRDRRLQKVNETAAIFAGRSSEEMISLRGGEALRCLHHFDDPQGCGFGPACTTCGMRLTVLNTFVTGQNRRDVEIWLPFRRGEAIQERCLVVNTAYLQIDNTERVLVCAQDITERERTERELRESEERFRLAFENANIGMCLVDLQGRLAKVNEQMCEIFGYNREELEGINVNDIAHPEDLNISPTFIRRATSGEMEHATFEKRYYHKKGHIVYGHVSSSLVRNAKGEPQYFISHVQDVTERKKVEETIKTKEAQLSNALIIANLGHWEYDVTNDLFTFNDYFFRIFRTTAEREGGYTMSSARYAERFLHPEDQHLVAEEIQKAIETTDPNFSRKLEHRIIYADGKLGYITVRFFIVKDDQGRTIKTYGVNQDMTEWKKREEEIASLQEQLYQAQKMEAIGKLAGGVAHDFNNLLTIIKGYLQLSLLELDEGTELKNNIDEAIKAADKAAGLTRQLLAFSRRQVMEMKVLDLNDLLNNVNKMITRILGEDIEVQIHLSPDLGRVKLDQGQMEQVILNLAVNAKDAMPDGGKFIVKTYNAELDEDYARCHPSVKPGLYVMLSVTDTGIGMTPEVRNRIFEPFFTTKEKGKGTGLGLSTVYGIVKQSGGNIWVYSELGKGTTFKIYLPRVDEPLEVWTQSGENAEVPHGRETILIVEDEKTVREVAIRILKKQGYRVLDGFDGDEALRFIEEFKEKIDLILIDVVLPKMSGPRWIEKFNRIRQDFKVIYMSGYTDDAIAHHGILDKGVNYLEKPFTFSSLAKKVRRVLDQ